jgi:hypothetical protein
MSADTNTAEWWLAQADGLVQAPDRIGWRGHTLSWWARAYFLIHNAPWTAVARLAPVVDDSTLLTPSLACLVPLRRAVGGGRGFQWSALWRDTQHHLLRSSLQTCILRTLSAFVLFVRHRPRLGGDSRRNELRQTCDITRLLAAALDDRSWQHVTPTPCFPMLDAIRSLVIFQLRQLSMDPEAAVVVVGDGAHPKKHPILLDANSLQLFDPMAQDDDVH